MFLKPKLQEVLGQDRHPGHTMSGMVFCSGHSSDQILTFVGQRRLVFKSAEASSTYLKVETNHLLSKESDSSVVLKDTKASDKLYYLVPDEGVCAMLSSCSKSYRCPLNFKQQKKVTYDSIGSTIHQGAVRWMTLHMAAGQEIWHEISISKILQLFFQVHQDFQVNSIVLIKNTVTSS